MSTETFIEPRCRVCTDEDSRAIVNDLLAKGHTFAAIARAVASSTEPLSVDSIRRHAERHFPIQDAARATYREIIERRISAP